MKDTESPQEPPKKKYKKQNENRSNYITDN